MRVVLQGRVWCVMLCSALSERSVRSTWCVRAAGMIFEGAQLQALARTFAVTRRCRFSADRSVPPS